MLERNLGDPADDTLYQTWTGEGLLGPGRGKHLPFFDALWGLETATSFLHRFGGLPAERCRIWRGDEKLGIGAVKACNALTRGCDITLEECYSVALVAPRATNECLELEGRAQTCDIGACVPEPRGPLPTTGE